MIPLSIIVILQRPLSTLIGTILKMFANRVTESYNVEKAVIITTVVVLYQHLFPQQFL